MGRDKALLPYRGTTLLEHVARAVAEACGSVALIGDPARYGVLGYPAYRDLLPSCGPIGGIYTALSLGLSDWNLVVACDMPGISVEALRMLLSQALVSSHDCVIAMGPGAEREPLCAVYHQRCLPVVLRAIRAKRFKMKELVAELDAGEMAVNPGTLANVNTPAEWAVFEESMK